MTVRHATTLAAVAGALTLFARAAQAVVTPCASIEVGADARVLSRWPGVAERVRAAFEARDDIDRCARITLATSGPSIEVAVELPDGRVAARTVSEEGDVLPTLEALLLVPDAAEPSRVSGPAPSPPGPPAPRDAVAPAREAGPPERDDPARSSAVGRGGLRIELSALTGARVGDGQAAIGLGVLSLLDVSGWLAGFEGRVDRYQELDTGARGGALELSVLGGRRFPYRSVTLDLTTGFAAVYQGTSTVETQTAPSGPRVSRSQTSTLPRLLLGTRLNFDAPATFRTFVGIDGELGPGRPAGGVLVEDMPPLPLWTVGVSLGATVGTL